LKPAKSLSDSGPGQIHWKDKRHGQGTCTWPSGTIYIGNWKDDKLHGDGTLTHSDGRVSKGMFIDNTFIDPVRLTNLK